MRLSIVYDFLPKERSLNTSYVMDHFGIDFEQGRHVIAEAIELDPRPGGVVLFVGPSGSGKSSMLRESVKVLAREGEPNLLTHARSHTPTIVWIDQLTLADRPLVDAMPLPVQKSLEVLSACGLSEAQLLLRTPAELSDGQRYRFRLALGIAQASPQSWLVADEFTATLDRTLAKVLAYHIRRLASRTGIGFLLATTHEDIVTDLDPDVLVRCDFGGRISVENRVSDSDAREPGRGEVTSPPDTDTRNPTPDTRPRRAISFFGSSGSVRAPVPTGRTSLGGITAATTCAW